jgi:hypothetical protein
MSSVIRVYDPKRTPPEWNGLLRGSEVAVFKEHALTGMPLNDTEEDATCIIFADLASARTDCEKLVAENPDVRCTVFDARGKGSDPLAIYDHPRAHRHELTGRFRRWCVGILMIASLLLIWLDWRSDFVRMWPSVLAWKFVTTALVFIVWEFTLWVEKRRAARSR